MRSHDLRYPGATVEASTLDAFFSAANEPDVKKQLPLVTAEIGDGWIYGVSKHIIFLCDFIVFLARQCRNCFHFNVRCVYSFTLRPPLLLGCEFICLSFSRDWNCAPVRCIDSIPSSYTHLLLVTPATRSTLGVYISFNILIRLALPDVRTRCLPIR
jgi:hypothetical protein